MYSRREPICKKQNKDDYKFDTDYYNGETIINYEDGSSTRVGGGPAGPMNYDEYGEEC